MSNSGTATSISAFEERRAWLEAATRNRRGETLFIDARKLGVMVDRTHRELTDEEIARIARTYHAWRGEQDAGAYEAIAANLAVLGYPIIEGSENDH